MTHLDLCRCELDEVRREILDLKWSIRMACPQATVWHMHASYGTWTDEVVAEATKAGLPALD
ncbi:polysaccharide deacetylase family protein [Paraburkholderia dilworthii]|uniref:polysaccharide deacetylase family protein n=1 Tax=Paraburkholderia dilworthii TaxID=948106 RepID=UPI001FCAC19A|nr:polysaccharide deacetylase family protein [Paraburkholderia dilworthii]